MNEVTPASAETLKSLNKLLMDVLRDLAAAGQSEAACRHSAQAWKMLQHEFPDEAQKHNGLLHFLTAPPRA